MAEAAIVEKARCLLRLRKRATTAGEAEAAARALARLIERHRIDEAALEQPSTDGQFIECSEPIVTGFVIANWKEHLVALLCALYSVHVCRATRRVRRANRTLNVKGYFMCGTADDIAIARHMVSWISTEASRLGGGYIKRNGGGRRVADSWRLGFVHGICLQIEQAREQEKDAVESSERALAVLDSRLEKANSFFEKMHGPPPVRKLSANKHMQRGGYVHGKLHGENFHLGKSLPHKTGQDT